MHNTIISLEQDAGMKILQKVERNWSTVKSSQISLGTAILFMSSSYHNRVTEFNTGINVHLITKIIAASDEISLV